ncbi:hypothetical protein ACQKOH_05915 [Sphingomonas sp. NPDC092331]|jgi:hypothetical protein|nr:hypothetical protein [Pseudomonadota bacterium]
MSFLIEAVLQGCLEATGWLIAKRFGMAGCLVAIPGIALPIALLLWWNL